MKTKLSLFLAIVLIATLVLSACGGVVEQPAVEEPAAVEEEAEAEEKPIIAISLPNLDIPHFVAIQDGMIEEFSDEYDVQVSSAENDPIKQAQQVQNYTAMGAKLMFVLPVEASSLIPKMVEFREAGGMIFVVGGNPGNPDAYDAVVDLNEFAVGLYMAYMAKQWVEETYPDAPDGSVETVILERTDRPLNVTRTRAIWQIAEPYLKNGDGEYVDLAGNVVSEADKVENPTYSPKVKVVDSTEAADYEAALNATQNFLVANPDLKLVIGFDSDAAQAASQAMVDEYAKGAGVSVIEDLSKVATFGAGMFGAEGYAIVDSATNDTVFRGTLRWGGKGLQGDIEMMHALLEGTAEKNNWQDIWLVTLVDGELVSIACSKEAFAVPTAEPEPYILEEPAAVEEEAEAEGTPIIAISLPNLDIPHFVAIQDGMIEEFSDEYDVQVSSAENDPIKQAQQVENYTAMGAKLMFVLPVEASSLIPKMVEFREAGGMIFVVGGNPGNPDAYDAVVDLNEFAVGLYMAYMAKQWVEETYPDAPDGSVETVILERTDRPLNVTRTRAIWQIAEPYLKNGDGEYVDLAGNVVSEADKVENPVYCPKVKVVGSQEVADYEAALNATQNFLVANPDLKLVIGFDSDAAQGASQAMVDEYAKGAGVSVIDDLSKVATFGAGMFADEGYAIVDSATNDTVFRGTLRWGGKGLQGDIEMMHALLDGTAEKNNWQDIWLVTLVDGELVSIACSKEAFAVPTAEPEPYVLED